MHRMDWDDLRYFLAIARRGSVRAAAEELSVNHTTVSRRISQFEQKLGVRLFDRLPTGYALTVVGEEMVESAERIEDEVLRLNRQVTGRDTQLSGVLRVTMPGPLATHLLMPDLARFSRVYPGIKLELAISYNELDLKKREADVAIRITNNPPDYLIGKQVATGRKGIYASRQYAKEQDLDANPTNAVWLGWEQMDFFQQAVRQSPYAQCPVIHQTDDPYVQLEAVRRGMGIAILPCIMGDNEADLTRLSLVAGNDDCGNVWLLTHRDLRSTARVRVFFEFMSDAFNKHEAVLQGQQPTEQPVLTAATTV